MKHQSEIEAMAKNYLEKSIADFNLMSLKFNLRPLEKIYFVNDDSRKAQIVDTLLKKAGKGDVHILMPSIVVAELVWVLESFYRMETEDIADLVDSILNTPGLTVSDDSIVRSALKRYKTNGVDLVDAWIVAFAQEKGASEIHTFDKKHFKGIDGVAVVQL